MRIYEAHIYSLMESGGVGYQQYDYSFRQYAAEAAKANIFFDWTANSAALAHRYNTGLSMNCKQCGSKEHSSSQCKAHIFQPSTRSSAGLPSDGARADARAANPAMTSTRRRGASGASAATHTYASTASRRDIPRPCAEAKNRNRQLCDGQGRPMFSPPVKQLQSLGRRPPHPFFLAFPTPHHQSRHANRSPHTYSCAGRAFHHTRMHPPTTVDLEARPGPHGHSVPTPGVTTVPVTPTPAIPLTSPLRPEALKDMLASHPNRLFAQYVVDGATHGFHIDASLSIGDQSIIYEYGNTSSVNDSIDPADHSLTYMSFLDLAAVASSHGTRMLCSQGGCCQRVQKSGHAPIGAPLRVLSH